MISYRQWKLNELLNGMGGENPPVSTSSARPISASPSPKDKPIAFKNRTKYGKINTK